MKISKIILAVCLLQLFFSVSYAQSMDDKAAELIDVQLSKIYPDGEPGATIMIINNDQVFFEKSYGVADIETGMRISPNLSFRVGSLTKQFTAAAIMKLVEKGALSVSDPVSKYLPGLVKNGDAILVENLLTHTSGIGNFENLEKTMMDMVGQNLDLSDNMTFFIDQPSEFEVGTAYQYSNPGYILLGAIVEKVSGRSYEQFIKNEIFEPLNMENSYFESDTDVNDNHVQGYHREESGYVDAFAFNVDMPYAAGGLLSTIGDIRIWNNALWSGKVISQTSLKKMTTPFALTNGKPTKYGYGLEVLKLKNKPLISHQGGIFGFQSFLATLPEQDIQIILLTNTDNPKIWPHEIAYKIFDIVLD